MLFRSAGLHWAIKGSDYTWLSIAMGTIITTSLVFLISCVSRVPSAQAAVRLLDEMCHLTAQSLPSLETQEHYQVVKLLGEGSYGKVMLAVHRIRGEKH